MLQAHEEEVCNRDLPILQAYALLQEGTDKERLLKSFEHMHILMHFPHHTFISTRPGAPSGSEATEQELNAFRKGRSAFLQRQATELQKMRPEQQLQKVKAAASYVCITARECLQATIINKTPERAQRWQQALQDAQGGAASSKKRSRSKSRRSNGSSSKGTKSARLDEDLEEDLAGFREQMQQDRELAQQQVDIMRDIKDGLQALASGQVKLEQGLGEITSTQQQAAMVLNQVGVALAQLLQKQ